MTQTYNSRHKDGSKSYVVMQTMPAYLPILSSRYPTDFQVRPLHPYSVQGLPSTPRSSTSVRVQARLLVSLVSVASVTSEPPSLKLLEPTGLLQFLALDPRGLTQPNLVQSILLPLIRMRSSRENGTRPFILLSIVCTDSSTSMPLAKFLHLRKVDGTMVQVGL